MIHKFTNKLIDETSPYLLQHAHNPVEWFAWGTEAFEKAKKEDKPILVSIGYAACHWCHVMERESFEDEKTAAFMNKFFVNIKIDREERPDVDHIYMQACQVLTGGGGWPLNMFLTQELKPFTGGTYFPPKPSYGKPSWMDVLIYVYETFEKQRDTVEQQAEKMLEYLGRMDNALIKIENIQHTGNKIVSENEIADIHKALKSFFDTDEGGFGNAPKFPSAMTLKYLLRKNFYSTDKEETDHIHLSLYKMIYGGIYDQLEGGFARYSVDRKWIVPHFEKMLYDNALLVQIYGEAYMVSGDEEYKRIVDETLQFVMKEMMTNDGGFYSSYDADSEGVEGKFYTWSKEEIEKILIDDAAWFCKVFNVFESGNWEHTNTLYRNVERNENDRLPNGQGKFKQLNGQEKKLLRICNQKLLAERDKRIKPGLDDKIILSWNALMCSGFIAGYKATNNIKYKETAERNIQFVLKVFRNQSADAALFHTYKNDITKYPAMLEDYASLITALIDLYEISGDIFYIEEAISLNHFVIDNFSDENDIQFYFTQKNQTDIPLRNKELYDHATPSGNALMLSNLIKISIITGDKALQERADKMFLSVKEDIIKYPSSFGMWLIGALQYTYPILETAICGVDALDLLEEVNRIYYPNRIIMIDTDGSKINYPLLNNKFIDDPSRIFNCRNYNCQIPVISIKEYIQQLKSF